MRNYETIYITYLQVLTFYSCNTFPKLKLTLQNQSREHTATKDKKEGINKHNNTGGEKTANHNCKLYDKERQFSK